MNYNISQYGDSAVLIQFKNEISYEVHYEVRRLYEGLRKQAFKGVKAVIPAYNSITLLYESTLLNLKGIKSIVKEVMQNIDYNSLSSYQIEIPICYESSFAIDKETVLNQTKLSWEEVVSIHSSSQYLVYMLGFVPGFLYLGGLDERLFIPRLDEPRLKVESGSIGLASNQTGVYPMAISGGWQIIGRTPVDLLELSKTVKIEMGDFVKFFPITSDEYKLNKYQPKRMLIHGN
ncbi:MAG: 5-oxoprolinase subunit PxpB [Flavobacteriales bacterium]|nr:5-oxoprolinase subunit PxpB [Flavobacteriales bacterium]